jgi:hypothetical protein
MKGLGMGRNQGFGFWLALHLRVWFSIQIDILSRQMNRLGLESKTDLG